MQTETQIRFLFPCVIRVQFYQFDFNTGAIDWILGGKASTLKGYEGYASTRTDDNGVAFQALTFGQHFARYTNKDENGMITGNTQISVFDNHTGIGSFLDISDLSGSTCYTDTYFTGKHQ